MIGAAGMAASRQTMLWQQLLWMLFNPQIWCNFPSAPCSGHPFPSGAQWHLSSFSYSPLSIPAGVAQGLSLAGGPLFQCLLPAWSPWVSLAAWMQALERRTACHYYSLSPHSWSPMASCGKPRGGGRKEGQPAAAAALKPSTPCSHSQQPPTGMNGLGLPLLPSSTSCLPLAWVSNVGLDSAGDSEFAAAGNKPPAGELCC